MSLIDETENDREIRTLREKSLSFRLLQLISYLESNTQMSNNLNVYAAQIRVRGKIADSLHSKIYELVTENELLKQERERLNRVIVELKEQNADLEEDLSKYEQ